MVVVAGEEGRKGAAGASQPLHCPLAPQIAAQTEGNNWKTPPLFPSRDAPLHKLNTNAKNALHESAVVLET